jgi:eukaryotic-like serine/threonine-protein kinase
MATRTSKYRLGERIGAGGMGEVFLGELHGTQDFMRPVAIKRLHPLADRDASELLTREARICSRLHHPNVVSVLDFERDDQGRLLLIMEWVDGVELATLAGWRRLPIELVEYIAGCMLRGLHYAHERGVIHRDVTPYNVLISRTGEVKLTDFGLAKALEPIDITTLSSAKGTPGYISPEQFQDFPLDGRADLFAVGVILYELLTGVRPFHQRSTAAMVAHVLKHRPTPASELQPELAERLNDITMRLLEKDPDDRFESAQAVLDALPESKYGAEDLAALVRECIEERARVGVSLVSGRTGRAEDNAEAMQMPEYQAHRAVGQGTQSAPEEDKPEPKARRRRGKRGVFLALVAFCAGIAVALIWLRGTPDAPVNESAARSIEHEAIEDVQPDGTEDASTIEEMIAAEPVTEDARSAIDERIAAEPVTEDAATIDAAASVPATPAPHHLDSPPLTMVPSG